MCICFICILSSSLAIAEMVSGKSLIDSIKGSDHENVNSIAEFYDGYISGVADSTVNYEWCPPNEFKRGKLQRIVIKYYKSNSDYSGEITESAKELILRALKNAYPCG